MIFSGIDISLPDKLFIGRGLTFFCKGWVFHPIHKIVKVELSLGDKRIPMEEINMPRYDVLKDFLSSGIVTRKVKSAACTGFSGCFELPPEFEGTIKKSYFTAFLDNGRKYIFNEKEVCFQKKDEFYSPISVNNSFSAEKPLVTICMAAYSPEIESLKIQLDSIKNQTWSNWICIINDDCSDGETVSAIKNIIAFDERFYFFRNSENLGYYLNFERALRRVPLEAEYVTFSDQDDFWNPDKLEKLINRIESDSRIQLAYSDMKIVNENGKTMSDTYWTNRKNHYKNLSTVMVCGTITGAASIFRRSLLKLALPFPQNIGRPFHDHLISCTALATGKVSYIDEPLYNYRQHISNVIGHCDFDSSMKHIIYNAAGDLKSLSQLMHRLLSLYNNYEDNYLRLRLMSGSLRLRGCNKNSQLRIFDNSLLSVFKLMLLHLKAKIEGNTTENAELVIAASYIARRILKWFVPSILKDTKAETAF